MRLRISTRGRVRKSISRSVGPSVRRSVPCYFQATKIAVIEVGKTSNEKQRTFIRSLAHFAHSQARGKVYHLMSQYHIVLNDSA